MLLACLGIQACLCQTFSITGYENLTAPGDAHLFLTASSVPEGWMNQTLRIEMSGAMAGTLIYSEVLTRTDLGHFDMKAGNYTFDIYVLERFGATVGQSGSVAAHEEVTFSIPEGPGPKEPDESLIDPVNLGFMIIALFIFGLVLVIWRPTSRPTKEPSHAPEEG